ncbi:hypothetical protein HIM_10434 [Hirsutella minnesotensis 3608]|uniref:Uncharacterized protein n=1 Tax=Hirsutella minnesotensis 3608 TaxID=1043627 RepID=A0A0F8A2B5_9HYPO|nr:hypothetical protein HIM_10434 [Hirsutella minnesotensis 3608]
MFTRAVASAALALLLVVNVYSTPVLTNSAITLPHVQARGLDDWQSTLSQDTRHRLDVARQHLHDATAPAQAFRNDTIMRINIEREALDLPLVDISQAFEMKLPASRAAIAGVHAARRSDAQDFREEAYLRSGGMTYPKAIQARSDTVNTYSNLLNRENLALGAIERINIAHRILGKPNFIEGGQANGFGFTQSTFHKLHCLANLRMILSWHIAGNGDRMERDMNAHTIHCLEYIRSRELKNPDLNEEPIDTVDYKGMGIH